MSNVLVDKNKIDVLANAISAKSGESLTLTLDEMVEAVDGIETGGGITPSGNIDISSAGVTDVTNYATATVPSGSIAIATRGNFITINGTTYFRFASDAGIDSNNDMGTEGYISDHTLVSDYRDYSIVPSGTSVTPTESAQTIGGIRRVMEGAVTVNAIPSNYVGSGITRRSSTDLYGFYEDGSYWIGGDTGYFANDFEMAVPNGTAGTPTATKGAVSNHSVSVTPSVTNTTGYITGSTKTGTAVTVSASELVSGSETKTQNGTYDVTNLASLVVNVSGGGGSGLTLLKTTSLGTLSTSSTNASDTGKTMTVTGYNDYDLLVVDVSVDTATNGRHTSTVSMILNTGTSNVNTKNTYTVMSNKWNSKLGSTGTGSTRTTTTSAYGVYVYTASVSDSTMTLSFYYRYNSNNTGTLNGTYTARVYGVKLYDLIGG